MPRPPEYGIIYNWDGNPHGYSEHPQSLEAFLEKTYAPLEDTQVGAHFWCIGEHTARWKSKALEMVGEAEERQYEDAASYIFNENVLAMIERGEDAQEALISRGHELGMHVYASVRMNDNHFGGAQPEDMPKMKHVDLTRMRREHPEWLLGKRAQSDWFALSWDFQVPEVREHRFAHVKEICGLYDWDGVELDWQRHGFHLPDDYGYRLRYVLTDLQRAIRAMTNELAERRGRSFYLAARVSGTLEMCRKIGYDVPTWVEEGLVDILVPAASSGTDPLIDIASFKALTRGTDIAVYGGLYGGPDGPHVGPEDELTKRDMVLSGIASRFYAAGADGIHVFNWFANRDSRRGLLTSVGSPDTLRRKDKIHAATHRIRKQGIWRGASVNDRVLGEVPVPLKRTMTDDGPSITLHVSDDLAIDTPEHIELRVRVEEWVKGDDVLVIWDAAKLPDPRITYRHPLWPFISDVSSVVWQSYDLRPEQVPPGDHNVKVVLKERHPRVASDIQLTDVELVIRYGP